MLTTQGHKDPREPGRADMGTLGLRASSPRKHCPVDRDRRDDRKRWNGLARHLSTSRLPEAPGTGKRLEELDRGNGE